VLTTEPRRQLLHGCTSKYNPHNRTLRFNWLLATDWSAMTSRWLRTVQTADLTVGRCTSWMMNRWDCANRQCRWYQD